jgi:glycerol-3-phosphate dehydrogenase
MNFQKKQKQMKHTQSIKPLSIIMFERIRKHWRPLVAFTLLDAAGTVVAYKWYSNKRKAQQIPASPAQKHSALQWKPPSRPELLSQLAQHGTAERPLDLLIIGGGATGAGCAVDAAVRGLKVACVEREDWSSGTSSKSTKLVHGGVRYLEKAIKEFDPEQYKLVDEALRERSTFLQIAPHLTDQLPIMLPIYK